MRNLCQAGLANRLVAARRRAGLREMDTQTSSTADGRRRRRGTVDHGGAGEASRVRSRRRSMFVGVQSQTAEDDAAARPTPRCRSSSWTPAASDVTSDVIVSPHGLSLYDEFRNLRRSSCVPLVRKYTSPSNSQISSENIIADSSTLYNNSVTLTYAAVRLQLQTKVKVSQRPVRCIVNTR